MKKIMKKTIKTTACVLGIAFFLFISADLTLRLVSSRKWLREYAVEKISVVTGRQVKLKAFSLSFFGARFSGLEVSESGGFDQGAFFSAKRLSVRYSLFHLLHKHVVVRQIALLGLRVNVIKQADGTFNFADLIASAQAEASAPAVEQNPLDWRVSLNRFFMDKASFSYQDLSSKQTAELKDVFVEMSHLSLRRDFTINSNWKLSYADDLLPAQQLSGGLAATVNLGALDLSKAFIKIGHFIVRYQGTPFVVAGAIRNFENPELDLSLHLADLSHRTVKDFAPDAPAFFIKKLTATVQAAVDLAKQTVTLNHLTLTMPGAEVKVLGSLRYGNKLTYDLRSAVHLNLGELARIMPLLSREYKVSGLVNASADSSSNKLIASVELKHVGAFVAQAGELATLDGKITVNALKKARQVKLLGKLTGKLNKEPFQSEFDYLQTKKAVDVLLKASADRVILPSLASTLVVAETAEDSAQENILTPVQADTNAQKSISSPTEEKVQTSAQTTERSHDPAFAPAQTQLDLKIKSAAPAQPADKKAAPQLLPPSVAAAWPLPPINLVADVRIGSLDAPFFYGTDISFKADVKGLTPDLQGAWGSVHLGMGQGEIKDLYRLTNANALTKVLFVSLGVVSKVINSLNVFSVLNGIGSGLVSAVTGTDQEEPLDMVVQSVIGPDGQPMQIRVPYTARKIEGKMNYEKFETNVNFQEGVSEIRKGSFVSDMISFRLDGKIDFKTEEIDLRVHAGPGKHYVDGIMPLTLAIGGTMAEPQGSMSMAGSLSSVLTQTVANNFASNTLKKGFGGLFGLFKKKAKTPPAAKPLSLDEKEMLAPSLDVEVLDQAARLPEETLPTAQTPASPVRGEQSEFVLPAADAATDAPPIPLNVGVDALVSGAPVIKTELVEEK